MVQGRYSIPYPHMVKSTFDTPPSRPKQRLLDPDHHNLQHSSWFTNACNEKHRKSLKMEEIFINK